ncbi:Golgi transport complex subunit 1 [Physocladia obscura]|uniref:Conserved oligomeric Golgi complex subunit 1 n=1 Tax=Physocladia obscura TaxID=109957 RepID=A0AAD5T9E2_9FUNG|nr:Golgi transport complex subunit 1 [Physocladia obscura]
MNLSTSLLNTSSATVVLISLPGVSISSCSTRDTSFDVSHEPIISSFGYSMDDKQSNGVYPGIALRTANYVPNYFRLSQNECSKKKSIAILGSQTVGDSLGGLMIVSADGFSSNWLLRDISQDPSGGSVPTASICNYITDCSDLQVQYTILLNSLTLFGTNRGIYYSTIFPSLTSTYVQFSKATTGHSILDLGSSARLSVSIYVSSSTNCLDETENYVFVAFSTSSLRNNLIYSTENGIRENLWSNRIQMSSISSALSTYQFLDMKRYTPSSSNIYLVGIPISTCGSTNCANNAIVVIHNISAGTYTQVFTFPTSNVLVGLACHSNMIDCYAYGSELYHSIDGGNNWEKLFTVENIVNSAVEVFKKFDSSRGRASFALLTNFNNIYYGRAGINQIILARTFNPSAANLIEIMLDEMGDLFALNLTGLSSGTYSSLSSSYPMGFLKTISGNTRIAGSNSPYLSRVSIPLDSIVYANDSSFAAALVPVFIGAYRVQFYAVSFGSRSTFLQSHIGLIITQISGEGKALINSVSSGGLVADCTIVKSLVGDTNAHTPAVAGSLTIPSITVGDVTDPLVSDLTLTSTSLLTISGASWMMSDVGKTVVANFGSFLITSIASSTVASVTVYRQPLSVGLVASGSWFIYDFRAYIEYTQTYSQSITIGAVISGMQTVTLEPGVLTFSSSFRNMFLVTSSGWGVIQDIDTTSTLQISSYEASTAASYLAGSWSIFDTNDAFISGNFPSTAYRTRPWNLTTKDCLFSDFSASNITMGATYLNYKDNFTIDKNIQAESYKDNPYYPVAFPNFIIPNSQLYNFTTKLYQDKYSHASRSSMFISDIGNMGNSGLSIRAISNSLTCSPKTVVSAQLVDGCSPSRSITLDSSISETDFLYGSLTFLASMPVMRYLPVPNVLNDQLYQPKFFVNDIRSSSIHLMSQYTLMELNNRTDYCISLVINHLVSFIHQFVVDTGTKSICGGTNLYITPMDPTLNCSISWEDSSAELYHFRAQVVDTEFCLNLSVDFAVYVTLATPRTAFLKNEKFVEMGVRDADALFESRSVADVRVLAAKMDERYRDLIEAADCVTKMKKASLSLQDLFVQLESGCDFQRMSQQMKENEEAEKEAQSTSDKTASYPIAVQMKLLIDTPEQIWNSLENNLYLRASRLFQVASMINTNLQQVDTVPSKIPLTFPLVQRQWDSIRHFDTKILDKAKFYLKKVDLPEKNITESLCAVMLLERISPRHVFNIFLAMRREAISDCLKDYGTSAMSIPDLLKNLAKILQKTMFQLTIIFYPFDSNTSALLDSLITELTAKPKLSGFAGNLLFSLYSEKTNMHVIHRHLPSAIQSHIPLFATGGNNKITKDFVKENVDLWILQSIDEIRRKVTAVLKHVSSGLQLAAIRETLLKYIEQFDSNDYLSEISSTSAEWQKLCIHVVERRVPMWDDIFRPVFKELSMAVIENSLLSLSDQVETVVTPFLQALQQIDSHDRNVAKYIWNVVSKNSANSKINEPDLLCKTESVSVTTVTDSFEKTLESIKLSIVPLMTAGFYVDSRRRGSYVASPTKTFDANNDNKNKKIERDIDSLMNYFQVQYLKAIERYQQNLLVLLKSVASQKPEVAVAQAVFIARIAKAVAIKIRILSTPILKDEIENTSSVVSRLRQRTATSRDSVPQTDLEVTQNGLIAAHIMAMKIWIDYTCSKFEANLSKDLIVEDWKFGSKFIGVWEASVLHVKDESGKLEEEKLRMPAQASNFVVHNLFSLVIELNNLNGCIIEKPILKILISELANRVINVYQKFLNDVLPSLEASEKSFLQILFDYEFLIKVVDGCWLYDGDQSIGTPLRDTKVPALSVLALIRSLVNSNISDIGTNLAIAATHLSSNVERFYYRTSVLLGSLLALNSKPSEVKKNPSLQETHNIIAVVTQPPRFTMLLTSLPGASIPVASRSRVSVTATNQLDANKSRKARLRIQISANANANAHANGSGSKDSTYSISGSVISGVVGLVGAAQNVNHKSIFGAFGALMGSGSAVDVSPRESVSRRMG